jgi:hypothetical protein
MSSRGRRDQYPQTFLVDLTQPSVDGAILATVNLPVPRIPTANKATILEISAIEYYFPIWVPSITTGQTSHLMVIVSTDERTIDMTDPVPYISNGHTIDAVDLHIHPGTAAAPLSSAIFPLRHELETKDGHGVLVATDRLFISLDTINFPTATKAVVKVYYRYVEVSVQEYVGIIQSQS